MKARMRIKFHVAILNMDIFCKSIGPTISFTQLLQVFEAVNKRAAKNSIWTKRQKSH